MFYRFVQFYKAINPIITPDERTFVEATLSPLQTKLFYKQSQAEQRHALDVVMDLMSQSSIPQNELCSLFIAALLHDCGKSLFKMHIWQRVFIVCFYKMPLPLRKVICSNKNIFSKTIKLYKRHPYWGSILAKKAGVNCEIIALIKNHHEPDSDLGILLYDADNRN